MQERDFPELVGSVNLIGSSVNRRRVTVTIPNYLLNSQTRVCTIVIKNKSDVDCYIKDTDYDDSAAMIFNALDNEAFEFTATKTHYDLEVWSDSDPTNGKLVDIQREG